MDIAEKEKFETGQKSPYKDPHLTFLQLRQLSFLLFSKNRSWVLCDVIISLGANSNRCTVIGVK